MKKNEIEIHIYRYMERDRHKTMAGNKRRDRDYC